ncbi:MAG: Histidine kinase protein [Bacteroidetes bacterium]|nr:Histidine kinase protein [Bacteroidota bacterium]
MRPLRLRTAIALLLYIPCASSQHILKDYTTQDGLPDSRVAPIMQDSKGYMWFGTHAGLTRYDGNEYVNFTRAKDIPGIFGRDIAEDHTGAIWFAFTGVNEGGLIRIWNSETTDFSREKELLGTQVFCVVEDDEHAIWAGTDLGLMRIRFLDETRRSWQIDSFPNVHASALYKDWKGKLWIASHPLYTYSNGRFEPALNVIGPVLRSSIRSYAMAETKTGELWAGGYGGALRIVKDTIQFFSTTEGLPERGVWSFCEDNDGNFWVGTMHGLYRAVRTGASYRFVKEQSFGDAVVYDILLDREGNVWLASSPGLRKLIASDLLVGFPGSDILATPGFGPIHQSPDGTIYFGSRTTGLYLLRNHKILSGAQVEPLESRTFTAIFSESRTRTWFGLRGGGAYMKDGKRVDHKDIEDGLPSSDVHSFARTRTGDVLCGTSAGLSLIRPDGSVHALRNPAVDGLTIFDIKAIPTDSLHRSIEQFLLATNQGAMFMRLSNGKIESIEGIPRFSNSIIYEVLIDSRKIMWFGTDGEGLIRFDGVGFTSFTKDEGIVGNRVYALAEDSIGYIWVGTSSGLSQFDGSSFRNFRYEQGFGEIGLHGLMVDRDGYLWVSSFPGVVKIRPRKFFKSNHAPPIYISDMQVDTLHFGDGQEVELPSNSAVLTFRYAGLSFTDESNVRYKYKLDGFDEDWSQPVTHREVRYTHLAGGSYTFKVVARSSDGVWSAQPASISFSILPPVWARWWFIAGFILAISGAAYSLYRYRLEKALQLERTRSRIAMDLHDDIGSSLTRISVLSEVAQRQTDGELSKRAETLERIGETARELIDSLGDIVWSVDPRHDDLQNVIRRIVEFAQEVCEAKGIVFETDIGARFDQTRLTLDQRRDLFLLLKEAINNVVRHSQAHRLRFVVKRTEEKAVLELIDDGVGYVLNGEGSGHGLFSMKERSRRAGVSLAIDSSPGKGVTTTVELKTG